MENKKSKISNTEWFLVISALFLIDLGQIFLDIILIGLFLNRFIDIFVGMGFSFYLYMRGEKMGGKMWAGLIGTFLLEMIPGIDSLPLWGLDGLYNMSLSKSEKILEKVTGKNSDQSNTQPQENEG